MTEIAWLSGMVARTASNVQQSRYLVEEGRRPGKIHEESSARYSQTRLAAVAAKNHEPVVIRMKDVSTKGYVVLIPN